MTQGLSTITDRYDYDAWGNEYPIMISTLDNPYRYVGQLGYYTHWMDSSLTDLLHLGVRFYEPGVGRFSQVDPAGEGWNWYGYVNGQTMSSVDPVGLYQQTPRSRPSPETDWLRQCKEGCEREASCRPCSIVRNTACVAVGAGIGSGGGSPFAIAGAVFGYLVPACYDHSEHSFRCLTWCKERMQHRVHGQLKWPPFNNSDFCWWVDKVYKPNYISYRPFYNQPVMK